MRNNYRISVIVPVHNSEKYLVDALDSIFAQEFDDFEVICVDDGSEDATKAILDSYSQIHDNMKVVQLQNNMGAAIARNVGLDEAKGEYVIFLDSDDIFSPVLLSEMYRNANKWDADFCGCGSSEFTVDINDPVIIYRVKKPLGNNGEPYSADDFGVDALGILPGVPWNKLIKKDFLIENDIKFQSLTSNNDTYFVCCCIFLAKKIVKVDSDQPLVFHRVGAPGSISYDRNPFNMIKAIRRIQERFGDELDVRYKAALEYFVVGGSIWELQRCRSERIRKEYYYHVRNYIKKYIKYENIDNRVIKLYVKLFLNNEYESEWFETLGDYEKQLDNNADDLLALLEDVTGSILLWGDGKRGRAFQKFCSKRAIHNVIVTDVNASALANVTDIGFAYVPYETALDNIDIVVASNNKIYDDLIDKTDAKGIKCINLEEFCPLN